MQGCTPDKMLYTQYPLHPFIASEVSHKRKVLLNIGINFIGLPNIFKGRFVISSIPDYFENKGPPIICYKYNTPIKYTIFNYNELVSDLHTYTPDT